MKPRTVLILLCGALAIGAMVHCGGSASQPPTGPGVTVTTTTTTTQPPGIVLPAGMECSPTPPPLYGINLKVWDKSNPNRLLLDTWPQVKNVDHYCERMGMADGKFCATRIEGDPQRFACDYLAVGQAVDTGRWGPTWTFENQPCAPPGGSGDCINHFDNQFKVVAKATGNYAACATPLARVAEDGSRCHVIYVGIPYY